MKFPALLGVMILVLVQPDLPAPDLPQRGMETRSIPRVERVIDRGAMIELIVTCHGATGIIVFSKVEKMFCTPHFLCHPSFPEAARSLCRRDRRPGLLY